MQDYPPSAPATCLFAYPPHCSHPTSLHGEELMLASLGSWSERQGFLYVCVRSAVEAHGGYRTWLHQITQRCLCNARKLFKEAALWGMATHDGRQLPQ